METSRILLLCLLMLAMQCTRCYADNERVTEAGSGEGTTPADDDAQDDNNDDLSTTDILLIAGGIIFGVVIVIVLLVYLFGQSKMSRQCYGPITLLSKTEEDDSTLYMVDYDEVGIKHGKLMITVNTEQTSS